MKKNILWFKEIHKTDISEVGGKGANLGEMYNLGIPVPNGFVVTSSAYQHFVKKNELNSQIKKILSTYDIDRPDQLQQASIKIKRLVKKAPIPEEIALDIIKAYHRLSGHGGLKSASVAVRSSATAEDLPDASFAGQQETFLNVTGDSNVVQRTRSCWASLFTPRAIFYREKKGFDHFQISVAVPIQKMVRSNTSGVLFTINPVNNDKKEIVIEAVWGLGEYIVQGTVTPDQYLVDKETWKIKAIKVSPQTKELIYGRHETHSQKVPASRQRRQKIDEKTIIKLAKIGQKLHSHYQKPQDAEWAIEKNNLYLVQTRPITTVATTRQTISTQNKIQNQTILLTGDAASPGVGSGPVRLVKSPKQLHSVKKGEILVTDMTTPDFVPIMKIVSAIITNKGGQTSHAAIVSRELSIPCIVGTKTATRSLKNGQEITVNGSSGEIFAGLLDQSIPPKKIFKSKKKLKTATKLYVNLGEPDLARDMAKRDVDGVGLLRAEFMIANIGTHPKKMINDGKSKEFTNQLASNIKKFCSAFHPRPVIYRTTDFKTNEYRHLSGGKLYEPEESNPMLGYRGAVRYLNDESVFSLELEAIKKVRNSFGFKNLWIMIPFIHTPQELLQVKKVLASHNLPRSPSFKLFMMVEIPSNVILIDEFIKVGIDGISIGSNDLTMLTLGIDRDNSEVAPYFDELNPAVIWSLKRAITHARKAGIKSSICGQAPSNYPDLVEKLVSWGISSISVSPDAIDRTRQIIHEAEKKVIKKTEKNGQKNQKT